MQNATVATNPSAAAILGIAVFPWVLRELGCQATIHRAAKGASRNALAEAESWHPFDNGDACVEFVVCQTRIAAAKHSGREDRRGY